MARSVIPVVDLSRWAGAPAEVAQQVDEACQRYGFFQVVGHGVPDATIDGLCAAIDGFFALPVDEKLRWRSPEPEIDRGYAAQGSESLSYSLGMEKPPDLFEAFNVGPDDVDRSDPVIAGAPGGIFAPNFWPDQPESFRGGALAYYAEARRVATLLTDVFALALDLPEDFFTAKVDHSTITMRMINYERQPGSPPPLPEQMRMGAHTDYGICTVLYADPVPGLQIVGPDGNWIDVVPEPGALLVNLGDLLAEWTNDQWRSTIHRVVPPPATVDGSARRRSCAFFFDGNYDALIECLPTCVSADRPARYPPILAGEHLMAKLLGPRSLQASTPTLDTLGGRHV